MWWRRRAPAPACCKVHYPTLLADDPRFAERARALAAKSFELTSFLVEVLGARQALTARFEGNVTYHDSCSSLRELKVRDAPRRLLASVDGLALTEMEETEVCCGFGGTFSVKYPEISSAIDEAKARNVVKSGAACLLAGDLGCLLHIAGRLSRDGSKVECRHVAEVLAGMTEAPAIGQAQEGGVSRIDRRFAASLQAEAPRRALADAKLQRALLNVKRGFIVKRRERQGEAAGVRRSCAMRRAPSRTIRFSISTSISKPMSARSWRAAATCITRRAPPTRATSCSSSARRPAPASSPRAKSMVSEEIGLNAHLEAAGIEVAETDLGEHIIQIRDELPSHIIAPVIHLNKEEIAEDFVRAHRGLPQDRSSSTVPDLVAEARAVLREKFVCRRCRHHRRQPAHRRDRILGDRHQ